GAEELKQTVFDRFKSCCPGEGHLLLIQDFSQMGFSLDRQIKGLGQVDKGQLQGFYLQPVLAWMPIKSAAMAWPRLLLLTGALKRRSPENWQKI
ncbi:MAG TPA: hypothetical protein VEV15_00235, partial [Flavisolibacter sp.]|nr:hypothetical protein [Flavisolibacter sp.]